MTGAVSRRGLLVVLAAGALGALAACGKRSGLVAPPGEPSDFPRAYPNPSKYPHPDLGSGTKTKANTPPEQQSPSSPIDSGSTTGPGMEGVQPR